MNNNTLQIFSIFDVLINEISRVYLKNNYYEITREINFFNLLLVREILVIKITLRGNLL